MPSWTSELNMSSLAFAAFLSFLAFKYINAYIARSKLDAIPTVGPNGILSSYHTVWRFLIDGFTVVEEGCRKYPGRAFKIPTIDGWHVVVNGPKLIDDIRKAPDDALSLMDAVEELLRTHYTMSPTVHINPYHVDVIRTPLTRNIGARFGDVRDEVEAAFNDNVPVQDDWIEIPTLKTVQSIVVRVSNRLFVGLPLCRNADYCDLNLKFATSLFINATLINLFPQFLHPVVGRIFTNGKSSLRRALKYLGPLIEERLRMEEENGKDWPDKPNDYVSWLIDASASAQDWQKGSVEDLAQRVMAVNFAAIHTTSMGFTQALYHLAANPNFARSLRAEVEAIVKREGWTKNAMVQMRLMDSFLKESQRHVGGLPAGMSRITKKEFKLSDGTVVPPGIKVSVAMQHAHQDDAAYPSPEDFNGSRFADLREKEGEGIKHQMVTPTLDWITFGIGKHACPGRFFAVNELKALLAHVLLTYDVKFKDDAGLPPPLVFAGIVSPNQTAKVMFRKRQVSTV